MSTPHLIQTIIEVLLVGALVVGFVNEPAIADWEQGMINTIKKKISSYRGN